MIPEGEKEPADYFKAPPANAQLGLCKCGGFPRRRLQSFHDGIRSEPNPTGEEEEEEEEMFPVFRGPTPSSGLCLSSSGLTNLWVGLEVSWALIG